MDGKNQTANGIIKSTVTLSHQRLSTASAVCSNQRMNVTITSTNTMNAKINHVGQRMNPASQRMNATPKSVQNDFITHLPRPKTK